jgi:hypothetical protein
MLGANSLATKDNQVVLGDANVVEVYTTGVVKCANGVDGGDVATMSQLPDVSGLATKTALADTASQLRSEIITAGSDLQTVTNNGAITTNLLEINNIEEVTGKAKHKVMLDDGTSIQFRHQVYYWDGSAWQSTNGFGFGTDALVSNTGKTSNGFGYGALQLNTGNESSGFGDYALQSNSGDYSSGFGALSLQNNTGASCSGLGYLSLNSNVGSNSNGFGVMALTNNQGTECSGVGFQALTNNTGEYSNGIGNLALYDNTGGNSNGLGHESLTENTGDSCNGIGNRALMYNTGNNSNGFGYYALRGNTGANNTAIGHLAGYTPDPITFNYTNCTMLGANSLATKDNQVVLGDANVVEVYTAGAIVCQSVTETSDSTMKRDIAPIDELDWVDSLDFKQFKFKRDTSRLHYGIIAQQLQKLNKELVVENNGKLGVDYTGLLISVVAKQKKQIDSLQNDISTMKSDIEELKQLINDLRK